ncbi:FAD-binding monooxygenase [Sinorhizobium meliloti]|uniref:FAD-binding monooxygenase n=1 Tax=Rhizobium meliloti TaxID=382 RepID=A0A2J0YTC6_RHIML|nr:FAD-binding monooxygenase [Sinorhizobium meliloti]
MVPLHKEPVVIVGGGVAGLALARTLMDGAVPFVLIERRQMPADGGLALNLPGNAIQALAALGLREQIEAIGHPLRRREYRTARDKLLFEVDEDAFWGPALRPRSIRRSALVAALTEGVSRDLLRYDADVRSLEFHPTQPKVRLQDGTMLGASLIVGADGVRSTVRRELFGRRTGRGHALLADASWRFMAPNPGIDCWTVWAGADCMILLMPVADDEVYGWAAITTPNPISKSPCALLELRSEFPRRVRDTILHAVSRPDGLYHSPLEEVRLDHWHNQRVVLIGDAAHATAPVWAEGVALALEDAIVLGRTLSKASDIPAALVEFEARRRSRVAHVQAKTDAMSKAAKLPPFVRNMLLPFLGPKNYRQTYGPLKEPV